MTTYLVTAPSGNTFTISHTLLDHALLEIHGKPGTIRLMTAALLDADRARRGEIIDLNGWLLRPCPAADIQSCIREARASSRSSVQFSKNGDDGMARQQSLFRRLYMARARKARKGKA